MALGTSALYKHLVFMSTPAANPIDLPEELERDIFETAARLGRDVATVLLTVDKRVYRWCVHIA